MPLCRLALLLALPLPLAAQRLETDGTTTIRWMQTFASPEDDWINHIVLSADGNILVAGFLNRGGAGSDWRSLIAKLDLDGRILWSREHGAGGGVDAYWAVAEAPDGRLGVGGFTTRMGSGGIDAQIAVLTPDGFIIRENAFGGPGYDRATDIALADSGFVIAGFTEQAGGRRAVLLIRTSGNGVEEWRRVYADTVGMEALYLEPTADGGFVLAGTTGPEGDDDVLVLRVDHQGNEVWRRVIGERGGDDIPHNLNIHPDGRIQMTGYTQSWGARDRDMMALTLSPDGEILRQEIFGGAGDDRVILSALDDQGRNWITGYTRSAGAGEWDAFITRLDPQGGFEGFVTTIGGPKNDNGTAILPLADGSLLLALYSENVGAGRPDAVLLRLSAPRWTEARPGFTRRRIR